MYTKYKQLYKLYGFMYLYTIYIALILSINFHIPHYFVQHIAVFGKAPAPTSVLMIIIIKPCIRVPIFVPISIVTSVH
jgi:polyferredoxin